MRLLDIPTLRARFGTTTNGTYVPDVVPFDETFWRMIGLSLAEGHIAEAGARRRICWSFPPTDEAELVEEVRTFCVGSGVSSEEHRVGKACGRRLKSRWSPSY